MIPPTAHLRVFHYALHQCLAMHVARAFELFLNAINPSDNMKRLYLLPVLLCLLPLTGIAQSRTATVRVNTSYQYQHIDGFGGTGMSGTWSDVYTQEKVNLLWGKESGQIGLNIMRLRINPNESQWGEYGDAVKWARAANPDLVVFATPWTPPKMYKTQNTTKYTNDYGTTVWPLYEYSWGGQGSNGGAINPEYYDEYADFLERYRQTMEDKDAPIDIISIQNECDYTPTTTENGEERASYESCIYSPTEMAAMVKAARSKVDASCKIMGPECFGWGEHSYNTTLANISDAVENIDIWGNHIYGTNDWTFINTVTKKTGNPMWMTEYLIDYDDDYTGEFLDEHNMIESIETALKSGFSAYVYYNMLNDFFATNHGGSETELWKRAYVFGHYTKYVTGKTRIASSIVDDDNELIGGSAYVSDDGDSIVINLLNKSTSATYTATVCLPFAPEAVTQMATNDNLNMYVSDVSDDYATGNDTLQLQISPNTFYTFVFVKEVTGDKALATSYKSAAYSNPIVADQFMADPTAVEYNGRLYVYATNDQQEFEVTKGVTTNTYGHITQLACLSTDDMVNWINHGNIDVKAAAPWIYTSWAPSVVSREEADGETHFYMYFTNSATGIGVLTATSPEGPWTDPLGHALIDSSTSGLGELSNIIDPGVAINSETGDAYLTFGGGDITGTSLQPGNARIVKLGDDMTSLGSEIKTISAPCHFEANELNYINGMWVYSYCTRWTLADDWSSYSSQTAPSAASMVHLTATDPLADDWTYMGEYLPNPGNLGYPYGNNHTHLHKFGSTYYLFYHTQWLENQMGISNGYRNLQVSRTGVTESTGRISKLIASSANIRGVSQVKKVNPYEEQSGKLSAIMTPDWWLVRGVDFSASDANPAKSLIVNVKGEGTLTVHTDDLTADPVATVTFTNDDETVVVPLQAELSTSVSYLYFVLSGSDDAEIVTWQFSTSDAEADGVADVQVSSKTTTAPAYYNISGQRLTAPQQSTVTIVRYADGKSRKVMTR